MNKLFSLLIIASAVIVGSGCTRPKLVPGVPVQDGFETPSLSNLWATDKILASDYAIQSVVVRSGKSAIQITLHTSDHFEAGQHGNNNSERAELTEVYQLYSTEGNSYAFSFSMFLPPDFPIVDTRLVIAQWKQLCEWNRKCDDNSPVLAIRYRVGILSVTQSLGAHRITLWQSSGEDVRNKWMDFRFRIRFTADTSGYITAFLNDSLILNYTGATAYQENDSTGYPSPSRFYFKMGLYRDVMNQPMTIYIDDYSKELLSAEKK
ncbi:MAG TPA: polysaccharide lyase [Bacteroidota bacterium]|nr:polysaccharide lyase [Bacteroidota bacterium]